MEIKVVFEDESLVVFDKPCGLVVNDSETQSDNDQTLQKYLENNRKRFDLEEGMERNGIVHRLDKDTSGLLIVAKSANVLLKLQKHFKERLVKKQYFALAEGEIDDFDFTIDAPVGRNPRNPLKFAVVHDGKPALTLFKKLKIIDKNSAKYTLLEVNPVTGRTHQIRVHLCAYSHPVAGDPLYQNKKSFARDLSVFGRLMLHASKISFEHPVSDKEMTFVSEVPKEFEF